MSDFSTGVKKWAIYGNIFHWGDEWGGSHWVTEAGVLKQELIVNCNNLFGLNQWNANAFLKSI